LLIASRTQTDPVGQGIEFGLSNEHAFEQYPPGVPLPLIHAWPRQSDAVVQ
jgi:hypothetical protein